jgi:2-phosphosulfolactate phosphatase
VALIAAGERWPSGALRPAVEDPWGVGSVALQLQELGWSGVSVEAEAAVAAYRSAAASLPERLLGCVSGRELVEKGYRRDVDMAVSGT